MKSVFPVNICNRYDSKQIFKTRNVNTVYHGLNFLAHVGPKIWSIIPEAIKSENCLENFKRKIKCWKPTACPCQLCKIYLQRIGYIENIQWQFLIPLKIPVLNSSRHRLASAILYLNYCKTVFLSYFLEFACLLVFILSILYFYDAYFS